MLVLDPIYPEMAEEEFPAYDWTNFYGTLKEEIPEYVPPQLESELIIWIFVDALYTDDNRVNHRSRIGFTIYGYSNKQGGCKSNIFGSEFVAMTIACEYARGLRCKLRTFVIPGNNPTFVHGDNLSIL